jgi:hypothetical protein
MSEIPAAGINAGTVPELTDSKHRSSSSLDKDLETEKVHVTEEGEEPIGVIEKAEDVAIQVEQLPPFSYLSYWF